MIRRPSAILALAAALTACASIPPPVLRRPPVPTVRVVLLPEADGHVGVVDVRTAEGSVVLTEARSMTQATAGAAPASPSPAPADLENRLAVALAALPAPPAQFTLYFDPGTVALTPSARAAIPAILAAIAEHPAPEVRLVGHSDTVGSSAANLALGRHRAEAVAQVLMEHGVAPEALELSSEGKAALAVPTPDRTPEPRNRRVEITVR